MGNYRIAVGMEPTNDYEKAKQDAIQAMMSIRKLPPQQQQMLAEELVGAANIAAFLNFCRQGFGMQ